MSILVVFNNLTYALNGCNEPALSKILLRTGLNSIFKRTRRHLETKIIAHIRNPVGAGFVQFAVSTFGLATMSGAVLVFIVAQ